MKIARHRLRGIMDDAEDAIIELNQANVRIEALEVALRCLIANVETGSYESTGQAIDFARAVLAPEQKT